MASHGCLNRLVDHLSRRKMTETVEETLAGHSNVTEVHDPQREIKGSQIDMINILTNFTIFTNLCKTFRKNTSRLSTITTFCCHYIHKMHIEKMLWCRKKM